MRAVKWLPPTGDIDPPADWTPPAESARGEVGVQAAGVKVAS
jgi:hypothetical protein